MPMLNKIQSEINRGLFNRIHARHIWDFDLNQNQGLNALIEKLTRLDVSTAIEQVEKEFPEIRKVVSTLELLIH